MPLAHQGDANWSGTAYKGTSACFIFGLGPGKPQRFSPNGKNTNFQRAFSWPHWGDGNASRADLSMGSNGPPGTDGHCDQGTTYSGHRNQICGGDRGTWGETQLEVWHPRTACESCKNIMTVQ